MHSSNFSLLEPKPEMAKLVYQCQFKGQEVVAFKCENFNTQNGYTNIQKWPPKGIKAKLYVLTTDNGQMDAIQLA